MQFYIFALIVVLVNLGLVFFRKSKNMPLNILAILLPILAIAGYFWFCSTKAMYVYGGPDWDFFIGSFNEGMWQPRVVVVIYLLIAVVDVVILCRKPAIQEEEPTQDDRFK